MRLFVLGSKRTTKATEEKEEIMGLGSNLLAKRNKSTGII